MTIIENSNTDKETASLLRSGSVGNHESGVGAVVWVTVFYFVTCLVLPNLFIGSARSVEFNSLERGDGNKQTLSLVGYNYTNRDIESYTVDSASGGDIQLSSPTSGGGGIACCFDYYSGPAEKMLVKVRWQAGGCTYILKNPVTKAAADVRHLYYREKLVEVERKTTATPEFIETHIFSDGSVRVFLTAELSSPILRLSAERADRYSFPRCKNDKKPQQQ